MFEDFKIKVFLTVASEGNFTKAASILGVSQPAISQNIAELERQAGTKLFLRERGAVILTEEGRILLKYAQDIYNTGKAADKIFINLPEKKISVKTSDEIWLNFLTPIFKDFTLIHPTVSFIRVYNEEADLTIKLVSSSILGNSEECLAKIRVSLSPVPRNTEDFVISHEKSFSFDLSVVPSESFARTSHYKIIRNTLSDFITL